MDLLEYQAKALFQEMGIPILPSQRIDHPSEIKGLQLPYPVVLKSQVRAGGRGRAGGIRFVENTIDAIASARTIFSLPILGEYPKVLLAEAKYDADRELYLAVVLDASVQRPVLLGSSQGGIDIEAVIQNLQQVVVEQEFSPFYARRLAIKMGLQGRLIRSVGDIFEKMYHLFIEKDLDLVEINPLGISSTNEVMALDGKIVVNDHALGRHPDLPALASKIINRNTPAFSSNISLSLPSTTLNSTEIEASKSKAFIPGQQQGKILSSEEIRIDAQINKLNLGEREGNIAIICTGNGMAIATIDLLYQHGGKPNICLIINQPISRSQPAIPSLIKRALEQISQAKGIKVILINIQVSGALQSEVADAIRGYLQQSPYTKNVNYPASSPQIVVRILGNEINVTSENLDKQPIYINKSLDEAIAKTVSLAKSAAKKT
ncbi:MAG: ATP-grasp domain-containing protein [Crinalium sp.]